MSAVSLRASFYLHDCRNDRVRKTEWVPSLLQQASEAIYLPPEIIIWCYSQRQSEYTEMLVAMPHVEFVKGIPTALERDSYFHVNKQNLIVFDDQMINTSKDKRIANLPTEGGFNQTGFQENIPQDLLKYLKQQNLSPVPLLPAVQEIKGNMDDVLSRNDLRDDEKAKQYFQLQNKYLAFKEQLNTITRPEEIISVVSDLTSSTQDSSTATTAALSTPLNPFNVTPELTQAAISQKPEKESLTPPPPLNPAFLTSPPTLETPSQQSPKGKRRRIQIYVTWMITMLTPNS